MGKVILGIFIGFAVAIASGLTSLDWRSPAWAQPAGSPPARPTANVTDSRNCSREQEAANKRMVTSIPPSPDGLYQAFHPDYIQHNPEFVRFAELNGASAHDAFKLMGTANEILGTGMQGMKPKPGQPPVNPYYMVLAECDMVIYLRQHWAPDPQKPGQFYAYYGFDAFRVKDGKLYEHWDGAQIPTPLPKYLEIPLKDLQAGKR